MTTNPNIRPVPDAGWWNDHTSLVLEVARYGVDRGDIAAVDDLLYYFEKPWKYQELYLAYTEDNDEAVYGA